MNWNYLETFILLSENLSFSETAKILNTAQPVISRQIKNLEENLGYALFVRTRKQVALSHEGRELKRRLGPLVEEIQTVLKDRQSTEAPLVNLTIRMGSMYEAGEILLFPKVSRFLESYKNSTIHLTLMSSSLVLDHVAKGLLDFGFVYTTSDRKSILAFPVTQDLPVMIAGKKLAPSWKDLADIPFVAYRENDLYLKNFLERHLSKTEKARASILSSVNSHRAIINMVRRNHGLAVIPRTSAQQAIEAGQVEVILADKKPQQLYLICHEQTLIDKRKKAFLDYLRKAFAQDEA